MLLTCILHVFVNFVTPTLSIGKKTKCVTKTFIIRDPPLGLKEPTGYTSATFQSASYKRVMSFTLYRTSSQHRRMSALYAVHAR